MQCVILAGGLGTRLWPLTKTVPKALVPINGRAFTDYQLAWLARQEVAEAIYCIGFLGEQIESHVGDGSAHGLKVRYVREGEKLMGTAGALRLALDAGMLADAFFVLYGDSFLPIAFPPVEAAYRASGRPALMTVLRNQNKWDRSNVIFTPPTVSLYDKHCADEAIRHRMTFIDYGLSVMRRDVVGERVPAGAPADLADLFKELSLAGKLAGLEVSERFYEVGSQEGIADFSRYVTKAGI